VSEFMVSIEQNPSGCYRTRWLPTACAAQLEGRGVRARQSVSERVVFPSHNISGSAPASASAGNAFGLGLELELGLIKVGGIAKANARKSVRTLEGKREEGGVRNLFGYD
jgi:hypothetical protein